MAETQYRRLTRPRRRKAGFLAVTYLRSSLWLGDDHLLVIDSNGYSETYKRFYFQDIQAIAIRLTRRRLIWNWVLSVPIALWLLGLGYEFLVRRSPDVVDLAIATLWTLLPGVPLLLNNLFGPTCACTLRTAVQAEELPSLCRLRKTRRVLELLRPLIVQAQGRLAPEEIPARLQAWTEGTAGTARSEPAPASSDQSGVRPSSGAASSALPGALESSATSTLSEAGAPGDGRTPAAGPQPSPAEPEPRYVVDDPNAPPRILS
jgi:hypothetical protein